jgi:hypothetical protein
LWLTDIEKLKEQIARKYAKRLKSNRKIEQEEGKELEEEEEEEKAEENEDAMDPDVFDTEAETKSDTSSSSKLKAQDSLQEKVHAMQMKVCLSSCCLLHADNFPC